ncbi:hypothetical protein Tco_0692761, partial [Tanacetum coccineum]
MPGCVARRRSKLVEFSMCFVSKALVAF